MEFRYFVARMPIRWGRSRTYYLVGIGGVVVLATAYITLYLASGNWLWSGESWMALTSVWNSAFVIWLATLVYLRGRRRPRTDWSWAFAAGFGLAALVLATD